MSAEPAGPPVRDPSASPLGTASPDIAVVRLSALGDVVRILPVVNALRRAWPSARITWLIQPLGHRLLRGHPAVDEFVVLRRRGLPALRSYASLYRYARDRRFDVVLVLHTAFKAGLATALLRSPVKLGYDRARSRDLHGLFVTHRIRPNGPRHVVDEYFEFLEYLGVEPRPAEWNLTFGEDEVVRQRRFFAELGGPACTVVVGTSRPSKNWPPERYARLLEALESDFGFRCVLVGGPSPGERAAADRILSQTGARPVDALGDDVRRLAYLLRGSDLVISPDTGPLHIARALDVPVVGLFGYSNPRRFGPYRRYEDLVVDGYAHWPGEDYPCERRFRSGGMDRITVSAVLEKVQLAVDRYLGSARPVAGPDSGPEAPEGRATGREGRK